MLALSAAGGFLAISAIIKKELKTLRPIETQQISPDIYVTRDDISNVYFFQTGLNRYIAFDAGTDPNKLRIEMERLSISPSEVKAVFLTHSDSDHVGGIPVFKSSDIYLPEKEVPMIDGTTHRAFFMENSLSVSYLLIHDKQTITKYGAKVTAHWVPGHTDGHTIYVVNDRYAFTGDAFSIKKNKIAPFNKLFNMHHSLSVKNIDIIKKISSVESVFTAHYGYSHKSKLLFSEWE